MNAVMRRAFGSTVAASAVLLVGAAGTAPGAPVPTSAVQLSGVPAVVHDVADGKLRKDAPAISCASVAGAKWYTVRAPRRGAMVARLAARGELDGALAVYRIVRSQRLPVLCAATNRHGRARLAWYAFKEGSYLIGVARRTGSAAGPFDLTVLAAERAERPPGTSLPAGGARSTINPVLDTYDAWSVQLARGVTYRMNLTTPWSKGCIGYRLFRQPTSSFVHATPVAESECGGYSTFTPGIDGGGTYSVVVGSYGGDPTDHAYRLQVGSTSADDTAPGVKLANGEWVNGTLSGRELDTIDMYRFGVPRANQLTTIELHQKPNVGFDLLVLDETGRTVASIRRGHGLQALRLHLPDGRYYAVLRSRNGANGGYGLQVRVRDVTATSIAAAGTAYLESAPATPLPLTVQVTSASHGGKVVIEIDHFDPISRWHYAGSIQGTVTASGIFSTSWLPPSVGHFRARARFLANPYSSFSESGYVRMHVIEPLE